MFLQLPDDFTVTFDDAEGELTIGGVYLRLFLQQPAWVRSVTLHYSLVEKVYSGDAVETVETGGDAVEMRWRQVEMPYNTIGLLSGRSMFLYFDWSLMG
jgi:hypothetical protein